MHNFLEAFTQNLEQRAGVTPLSDGLTQPRSQMELVFTLLACTNVTVHEATTVVTNICDIADELRYRQAIEVDEVRKREYVPLQQV